MMQPYFHRVNSSGLIDQQSATGYWILQASIFKQRWGSVSLSVMETGRCEGYIVKGGDEHVGRIQVYPDWVVRHEIGP